jgi:hypothetical protein
VLDGVFRVYPSVILSKRPLLIEDQTRGAWAARPQQIQLHRQTTRAPLTVILRDRQLEIGSALVATNLALIAITLLWERNAIISDMEKKLVEGRKEFNKRFRPY